MAKEDLDAGAAIGNIGISGFESQNKESRTRGGNARGTLIRALASSFSTSFSTSSTSFSAPFSRLLPLHALLAHFSSRLLRSPSRCCFALLLSLTQPAPAPLSLWPSTVPLSRAGDKLHCHSAEPHSPFNPNSATPKTVARHSASFTSVRQTCLIIMHGLAESKWSKQRSGPQFFSTKVEPPTAPAETVLESVPASAQMAFSSPRATLREADEGHPPPKLATSAGPPGSHPVSSADQGVASTAPTRASIVRPVQESIAAPRPSPSSSAGAAAPRAPPKANGGNPWAAFAMAADPEGQAQDGRSYVGGRSYIVDKPAATSTARNHPSKPFPPPQNKTPKPQMNPPKPFSQPQNSTNQKPGLTSAGSGWSSSSSTSASQQSWSQSPQSQNNSSQRLRPISASSGWSSTPSASANQKPWTQLPRSATRPPVENRWAGKPLATTAMFTDDFFSTAKPRTQAPSTTSLSSAVDRQNQVQSQNSNGWTDQGSMDNNFTQKQDFTTNAHTRPGFSAESKPALAQWGEHKQQQASRWQMYEQQQQQEQQQQEREQEQEQQGQQQQPSQRQPHQPLPPPTHQSYQHQTRGSPTNGHKKELSNAWPVEDGGSITYPQPSAVNSESGRTSRMDAGSDIPDDPLFLQYPIGDGCHVVVAMYVERTAEAAASRFPTMTRKRQESSWKQKSVDEVATIFKQALTEEKKDVTG